MQNSKEQGNSNIQHDFRTLLKLMFITANEIAYPEQAPANTSDKQPPTKQNKYSAIDWRNITDNKGWLPIKIDYKNFKPKKYYSDVSQEALQKHLKALQKHEDLLKQFKHYEDFDRIDQIASQKANTYENHIDKVLFGHAFISLLFARIMTVLVYNHHYSNALWRHVFKKLYLYTLPVALIGGIFYQIANPVNHEYFRSLPKEIRMYESMAYDVDAYQYVNDIKYNFKYPERDEFYNTLHNVYNKKTEYEHYDAIKYYKRVYGLVDPQPFWNKGQNKAQKQTA